MKERLLNVIKWILITLGVLFLLQILFVVGAVIGASNFAKTDTNIVNSSKNKLKQIQSVIDYVEDYKNKNGKYPQTIQNVKVKNNVYYDYSTSDDFNCYTIKTKTKKDNMVQQYQHCSFKSEGSSSNSESYSEYSEK